MDADFWHQCWQRREIGFHQDQVHHLLRLFFPRLQLPPGARILVPLCGKSLDLLWLRAKGCEVIGVELSQLAVEEFFRENKLDFSLRSADDFALYSADRLQIYCGDFFSLNLQQTGELAAVYDRAALVALPPEMRADYVAKLLELLPLSGQLLAISFDYPQQQMVGPPFSVSEVELKELFAAQCRIEKLHSEAALERHKKLQAAGLQWLHEEVYCLRRTNPAT